MHGNLRRPSTADKARSFRENFFGTIVRSRYPHKPALHLSQALGISERGAQYLIDGERRVTAECLQWLVGEVLGGKLPVVTASG